MWMKICATTSLDDAILAADAGADALGFVFATSPRRITAGQVAEITPDLPPDVQRIGVFNTQDYDEITFVLQTAGLNGVQLHGELDFQLSKKLRDEFPDIFLIQTLHWDVNSYPAKAQQRLRDELRAVFRHGADGIIDALLLDSRTASLPGGTGRTFDWERAHQVLSDESGELPIIAAGGLHPGNVAEAIHALRPWGIDVASGVEQQPGRKDPFRLQAFASAARGAFAEVQALTSRTAAPGSM